MFIATHAYRIAKQLAEYYAGLMMIYQQSLLRMTDEHHAAAT